MKIIILVLVLSFPAGLLAQKHSQPDRMKRNTERLKTDLNLTESQYASIRKINTDFAEEVYKVRNNTTVETGQKRVLLNDLRKNREQKISQVLSDEQRKRWEEMRARQQEAHKQQIAERRAALKDLNLTHEQKSRLKAANGKYRARTRAHRSEQKESKEEVKQARKTLKSEHDAEVKSILTEDQYRKWKEGKDHRKHKRRKDRAENGKRH